MDARRLLDHYVYRLYHERGWPVGALMPALGITCRENVHHRLRRVRDGKAGDPPPALTALPAPHRPAPGGKKKPPATAGDPLTCST